MIPKERYDRADAFQNYCVEAGPRCTCKHARVEHTSEVKTPGLTGYDGPCHAEDCTCLAYVPTGMTYRELADREFRHELAIIRGLA